MRNLKLRQVYHQGSALISALFIMTLVAIAATAMSSRLQLDIYRTRMTLLSDTLYLASEQVTFWAMSELANPRNHFAVTDKSGNLMVFPPKLKSSYPLFETSGELYDLQARFNLNNLTNKIYYPVFSKLLENPDLKLSPQLRTTILDATVQWISPWQPGRGKDTLLSYYQKQSPPYIPGFQQFQSPSEWRLIQGVNAHTYQQMSELITALPENTPININTAPKNLLKALGHGLSDDQVNELITARGEKGISDMRKITEILQKLGIRSEQLTLESQYFLSVATVTHMDLNLTTFSIIKRSRDRQGKIILSLVSEQLNSL